MKDEQLSEAKPAFDAKVEDIADELKYGVGVSTVDSDWLNRAVLISGDKQIEICQGENHKGLDRLSIYAKYPAPFDGDYRYQKPSESITVAYSKTAAQIAKDIKRRLLPGYKEKLAEEINKDDARQASHDEFVETLTVIGEAVGVKPHSFNRGWKKQDEATVSSTKLHYFSVKGSPGATSMKVEVSLDKENVLKLVEFLKTLGPE